MLPCCRRRIVGLALASAVALGACATIVVDLSERERDFQPRDYREVYERWTREFQILPVDGIENVLTATVTHLSYEFRWAYVVKNAQDLRLSPSERQQLNEAQFSRLAQGHEFLVSCMSGIDKAERLDPEDGPWKIRLVDDRGRQVAPLEVTRVRRPSADEVKYFGFDPVHRQAWRILFPLSADDGRPILHPEVGSYALRFSSPYGQGEAAFLTRPPE
jgi:hypothetical protein